MRPFGRLRRREEFSDLKAESPSLSAAALTLMGADLACVPHLSAADTPRYLIAPMRQSRCPTPPEALDDIDLVDEDIRKWRENVTQTQQATQRGLRGGALLPPPAEEPGVGKLKSRLSGSAQFRGLMAAARFAVEVGGGKRESSTDGAPSTTDGDGRGGLSSLPPPSMASFASSAVGSVGAGCRH